MPLELEEAARVDGASRLGAFMRVTLPLVAPGLVATGIFAFILAWNEFIFALVIMNRPETQTMPVWLQAFNEGARGTDWGGVMAGLDGDGAARRDLLPHRPAQGDVRPDGGRGQGVAMSAPVVGVDVGGTTTRAVRFDGDLVAVAAVAAPTREASPAIVDEVARLVRAVAGVAFCGRRRDARAGRPRSAASCSSAVNLGISGDVDIAALLGAAVGVPVHLENDVNAAALGAFAHLEPGADAIAGVRQRRHGDRRRLRARRPPLARVGRRRWRDRSRADALRLAALPVRADRVRRGRRLGHRRHR